MLNKKNRTLKVRNPPLQNKETITNNMTLGKIYEEKLIKTRSKSAWRPRENSQIHPGERLYNQSIKFTAKDVELYI